MAKAMEASSLKHLKDMLKMLQVEKVDYRSNSEKNLIIFGKTLPN